VQTALLLMARYDGAAIIPIATVCRDFFPRLAPEKFKRKALAGKIALPIVRMDSSSQKSGLGVHINDLAAHVDKQTEAARKECRQLSGVAS
jgi:hypothetical protein